MSIKTASGLQNSASHSCVSLESFSFDSSIIAFALRSIFGVQRKNVQFSCDALLQLLPLQPSSRILSLILTWNQISSTPYILNNSCICHQVQPFVCGLGELDGLSEEIPFWTCHALGENMAVIYSVPYQVVLFNLQCYRVCAIWQFFVMLLYMYGIRWTLAYLSWNCLSLISMSTESLASTRFILHLLNNPPQDLMNKSLNFHYGSNAIIEYSLPIRLISHHTWPVTLTTDPARIVHDFHPSFANSLACPIFSWFHLSRIYFTPWCVQYFHDFISLRYSSRNEQFVGKDCMIASADFFSFWVISHSLLADSSSPSDLIISTFICLGLDTMSERRFVPFKFNLNHFDSLESISFNSNIQTE